ncbi:MAG: 3-hydroxyacyl-CoA dehydrogenase [Alphaproteobacteria bacterium]
MPTDTGLMIDRRKALAGLGALTAGGLAGSRAQAQTTLGKLVFLNLGGNKVMSCDLDGGNLRTLVDGQGSRAPDGITYDAVSQRLIWTNMGAASANDGTVMSCNLAGGDVQTLVAAGGTHTPKQAKYDIDRRHIYWSDREGMRVMRSNPDGSNVETLVQTGDFTANKGDQTRWCVGIALDYSRNQIWWSQKGGDNAGQGTIKRCNMEIPYGETPANRSDIKTVFSNLPEPIDMEIDPRARKLYWTDRGDNTVNRAPMDFATGVDPAAQTAREILVRGLSEAIGIYLDLPNKRMFYTSLGGEVGTSTMDGKDARMLLTKQGSLTGITLVANPSRDYFSG